MDLSRPFIRLPFAFDAERLAAEAEALPEQAWMAHPSRLHGNSAVALVSRDGGDNDHFDGPMRATPHLRRCPYMRQVMASFGEVLARSRLMRLAAGSEVQMHVDFNYHWYTRVRIHIPVATEPAVIFHCADQQVHMRAGECWIFNSWRRHRVINGGSNARLHLVIDTSGSSRFWKIVRDMEAYDPVADAAKIDRRVCEVPFDPEARVRLETERFNTAPVMAPGELDALVGALIDDFSDQAENDPQRVARYIELLTDFTRDWRATWYRFGPHAAGWPHYRRMIDALQSQLHPDPRTLLTSSNRIGVNPVIVQRILRPALSPELFDAYVGSGDAGATS